MATQGRHRQDGGEVGFVSHLLLLNALEDNGMTEADVELESNAPLGRVKRRWQFWSGQWRDLQVLEEPSPEAKSGVVRLAFTARISCTSGGPGRSRDQQR